jgi:3-deoxy-D-manno-octulosonic-acid transferase
MHGRTSGASGGTCAAWSLRLYTGLWRLALLPAWAWWAWRTRRDGGPSERGRWRERLGLAALPVQAQGGLLVHAASIGEGVAALALLAELRRQRPGLPILVTCTSFTGAQRLKRELGEAVPQAFLPFDTPGAMARLLDRARPRAIVLMETELWPNLLAAARARAIPVVLANARLSKASARAYARAMPLARPMLQGLHLVLAQSRAIAARFQALGVNARRTVVTGNIKADLQVPEAARAQGQAWRTALAGRPVLVAASTHAGEDEALLAAWPRVRTAVPGALLVLVPRHPQRFDAVAEAIRKTGMPLLRRSLGQAPVDLLAEAPVWLGDTLGEMAAWMALADLAFIGGSLAAHGGHSPLEAMVFGCPIASGRHVHNFAEAYRALDAAGAVRWLDSPAAQAVADALIPLLLDGQARQRLGAAALQVFQAGAGAAARSAQALGQMLDQGPGAVVRRHGADGHGWIDTRGTPALPPEPFAPATWQARGAWQAIAGGRGGAGFVQHGAHGLVLRHYRRGGWMARWRHDTYLGRQAHESRAMREFKLLARLQEAGLAVPRPVGARMQLVGRFSYRADLLVERIPNAASVADRLDCGEHLPTATWQALGAAVRRLHEQGVDHVDLNAQNLLLDPQGRVWIIDFDRCRERSDGAWKAANLARLKRSLDKGARKRSGSALGHDSADWAALLQGYRAAPTPMSVPDSRRAT